jgi:hypothetical protein
MTTMELAMDSTVRRTVEDLKEAIEQRESTNRNLPELFLVEDGTGEEEDGGEGNVTTSQNSRWKVAA